MVTDTAPNPSATFTRRFDLDWLRIIAFGTLIFYHIGMFFNTEHWHAKSVHANAVIEPLMWMSSPWRLPLLFFISGVAIRFLSDKLGSSNFALNRVWRLVPVIVFGIFVIVPPQTYSEVVSSGAFSGGFGEFYTQYAGILGGPWEVITPTYNHLWYVVYLLIYSVLLAAILPILRWIADSKMMVRTGRAANSGVIGTLGLILIPTLPFLFYRFTLDPVFPVTHALVDDWANHARSLSFVLLGYLFAKNADLWRGVDRALPTALILLAVTGGGLFLAYQNVEQVFSDPVMALTARLARVIYAWLVILSLAGLAQRFLNHDGLIRRYFTEAIFPYYILHQTIIVGVGFLIRDMGFGVWTEFGILVAATIAGCAAGFEITKRVALFRPIMGLKLRRG